MKCEIDVLISIPVNESEKEHTIVSSASLNLRSNGLVLSFDREIPCGTPLLLTFFLPDSAGLLDVKGRVVSIEKAAGHFNLVIEFVGLKPQWKSELDKILNDYRTDD